ncbi:6e3f3706-14b7-4df7-a929-197a7e1160d0 [Thermothielavioides terrestris]|uniref:6e3f3706-14b7-4df7-a929-197a7e1160d0 n=1 Tax=Thermothielavioides terrestris TaxID=2587410 RepID=A0A446BRL7_9PEZI|nr:6e3f3706-14b7-4df7-a929-197a7e1160d0 [Thermothielavioides terrestris]
MAPLQPGRWHVALKIFIRASSLGKQLDDELNIYNRIADAATRGHPGRIAVRPLLDSFDVKGPDDEHRCLVHPPLWDSVLALLHRNPTRRLPPLLLAVILKYLFQALDFLHTECHIAHTGIKADNIMFGIGATDAAFINFEQEELRSPSPRKEVDGRFIYLTRELPMPQQLANPVLCDFGSAVPLDDGREHCEDVQPDAYRAPEVILEAPWTYSIDIWNVGCMIWHIFEGGHLFSGRDPEHGEYRSRAHLGEMVALLGPPPPSLLARGRRSGEFFDLSTGEFRAGIPLPAARSLEDRETTLLAAGSGQQQDRAAFLRLMRKMLQWEPEKRSSARELLEDEWIRKHTGGGGGGG